MSALTRTPTRRRPRWERLLPDAWHGDSREAQWRRSRGRRVASALLVAVGATSAVAAVRPPQEPTREVVVAAREVPAGTRLSAGDVRTVEWPASASLPDAGSTSALVGQVLLTRLAEGEPVTASRLRTAGNLPPVRSGYVVVSVPQSDPTLAGTLRPGDTVDAWAASTGRPIGARLRVVATVVPAGADDGERLSARPAVEAPSVLVAVDRTVAAELARAQAGSASPGTAVLLAISPSG